MSTYTDFNGPLFIIGMQRSGTKLLRTIFDGHPQIHILDAETHFLPHWVKVWHEFGDLSNPEVFSKFYRHMQKSPYFIYTKSLDSTQRRDRWYSMCDDFTVQGVYEGLVRCDTGIDNSANFIWGDKSTSHINFLPLLKQLFPQAKFIHIIRDVRDYALSVNKAWKKNKFRASQRWVDSIAKARSDSLAFQDDYFEIKYEELLDDSEKLLSECCHFLDVKFDDSMLALSVAPENIGDAKGYTKIKLDNKGKYLKKMDLVTLEKIESIAGNTLKSLNYPTNLPDSNERLSKAKMNLYRVIDGFNLIRQETSRTGLLYAIKIEIGSYLTSRVPK